ncbi:hypothetical protein GCM10025868_19640 [Angustibacter aerolatus]|uniref:HTH hxlR-type domain-containing protein n=1 Tax=Angustibacter aerolatus TaxID=1162965 RepID=A0ABQ6JFZ0_9ACTN|nr:helix-turn-helix domain-containing protein [Angustibacter aerolatus]GMA86714.1 hypothetical protein GCM10025868_19640 [Angustibacter aerolatus]
MDEATGVAQAAEQAHDPRACDGALARAFGFLGKRWNGVILGTLGSGPLGFSDLRRAVQGISDSVLSDRLSEARPRRPRAARRRARAPGVGRLPAHRRRPGPAAGARRA